MRSYRRARKTIKKGKRKHRRVSKRSYPGKQHGGEDLGAIPKIVIQTSKDPIPENATAQLKKQLDGWEYLFFTDEDILKFFQENPSADYPAITDKFNAITSGAHKADLFRYYYIFMHGGIFIDSDLMLYDPLTDILGQNSFVSVWAIKPEGSVFNGFLGATAKHPIIENALKDLYTMTNDQLVADYTITCKNLGGFVRKYTGGRVKMLEEVVNNDTYCTVKDTDNGKISLIHYMSMAIPDTRIDTPSSA